MDNDRGLHPVDQHVGARIRMLRKSAGMSQTDLACSIGLTFQQIQKYERGYNRVSASKLYDIAAILNVPIMAFFDGLPNTAGAPPRRVDQRKIGVVNRMLETPEGEVVALNFPEIESKSVRRSLADVVRKLVEVTKTSNSPAVEAGD